MVKSRREPSELGLAYPTGPMKLGQRAGRKASPPRQARLAAVPRRIQVRAEAAKDLGSIELRRDRQRPFALGSFDAIKTPGNRRLDGSEGVSDSGTVAHLARLQLQFAGPP